MSVLIVGEYWKRFHGLVLSYLAIMLAKSGLNVYFSVLDATEDEEKDAEQNGVNLARPKDAENKREWILHMYDYPCLSGRDIRVIIGHYSTDRTGEYANQIYRRNLFPGARLFSFVNDSSDYYYRSRQNDSEQLPSEVFLFGPQSRPVNWGSIRHSPNYLTQKDSKHVHVINWCIPPEYFKNPIEEPTLSKNDPYKIAAVVLDTNNLDSMKVPLLLIKESASTCFNNIKRKTVLKFYVHSNVTVADIDKCRKILEPKQNYLEILVKCLNSLDEILQDVKMWGVSLVIMVISPYDNKPSAYFLMWMMFVAASIPVCVNSSTNAASLLRKKFEYFIKPMCSSKSYEIIEILDNLKEAFKKANELSLYLQQESFKNENKGLTKLVELCNLDEDLCRSNHLDKLQPKEPAKNENISVLVIGEHWKRARGLLLSFLAIMLANCGLTVYFSVFEATEEEEQNAKQHNVTLAFPTKDAKDHDKDWIFFKFKTFYPSLACCDIQTIIGHYNFNCTGEYATQINKKKVFPGAKLIAFIDDIPTNESGSYSIPNTYNSEAVFCLGYFAPRKYLNLDFIHPIYCYWCIPTDYFDKPIEKPNYSKEDPVKIASLVLETKDLNFMDQAIEAIKKSAKFYFENTKRKTVWKFYFHKDVNIVECRPKLESLLAYLEIREECINSIEETLNDIKAWGLSLVIMMSSKDENTKYFLFWMYLVSSGIPTCVSEYTEAGFLLKEKFPLFTIKFVDDTPHYLKEENDKGPLPHYKINRLIFMEEETFEKANELRSYAQNGGFNKGLQALVDLCRSSKDNPDNLQVEEPSKIVLKVIKKEPTHKIELKFNGKDTNILWKPKSNRWRAKLEKLLLNPEKSKLKLFKNMCYSPKKEFLIAKGSNGTLVYLGITVEGKEIAIKITREIEHEQLIEEENINNVMWKRHPQKFVKLHCSGNLGDLDSYICLDLCEYGLDEFVESDKYNEGRAKELCRQFMDGLQCLHSADYMHRDLKPQNILITAKGDLKIADFGLTRQMEPEHSTVKTAAGTRSWRPTETFFESDPKKYYTKASDIQVAGMLLHYILSRGYHPFGCLTSDILDMENSIKSGVCNLDKLQDESAKELVKRMLDKDPSKRPNIEDVLRNEYFVKRQGAVARLPLAATVNEKQIPESERKQDKDLTKKPKIESPNSQGLLSLQNLKIMLLCDEWISSRGGLSTFNRELALHLAEYGKSQSLNWQVSCMLTEFTLADEEEAKKVGVKLHKADEIPGGDLTSRLARKVEKLADPPDVVIGHSNVTGPATFLIQEKLGIKRIQFLHTAPGDLGMVKGGDNPLSYNEKKEKTLLKLCEGENVTIAAVGPYLRDYWQLKLRPQQKSVTEFTPGLNRELSSHQPKDDHLDLLSVVIICRGEPEDREVKGMDVAGEAIKLLASRNKDAAKKLKLTYVGAKKGSEEEIKNWFGKETGIQHKNLSIKSYADQKGIHDILKSADLLLMPSRAEGFGLIALEAISAAVPVLVSAISGLAETMEKAEIRRDWIVNSDNAEEWANKIESVLLKTSKEERIMLSNLARSTYAKKYSWYAACKSLFNDL